VIIGERALSTSDEVAHHQPRSLSCIVRDQPATRVLILTTFGLDAYVYDALHAGASGFMLKDAPPEEIAAAVQIIARAEALFAPAVTRAVIEEVARQHARRLLAQELAPTWAVARASVQPRAGAAGRCWARRARPASAAHLRSAGSPSVGSPVPGAEQAHERPLNRRPAAAPLRLRPTTANQFSMPAQQRLRGHDQPVPTSRREHSAERGKKSAIDCSKRRPLLLATKHRELQEEEEHHLRAYGPPGPPHDGPGKVTTVETTSE
jgi:hypothetical protein